LGDVAISWENEAYLTLQEFGADKFEIVVPSESILAEPPVALVDKNADGKGTREVAEAYLKYLYTPAAQAIIAKNFIPPRLASAAAAAPKKTARHQAVRYFGIWWLAKSTGSALQRRRCVR